MPSLVLFRATSCSLSIHHLQFIFTLLVFHVSLGLLMLTSPCSNYAATCPQKTSSHVPQVTT